MAVVFTKTVLPGTTPEVVLHWYAEFGVSLLPTNNTEGVKHDRVCVSNATERFGATVFWIIDTGTLVSQLVTSSLVTTVY